MANEDLTQNLQAQVAEFIGSTEVCKRLEIDRSTLTRWIQLGRIKPAGKLPGPSGAYLWDSAYVDELVDAGGPPPAHNPFTSGTGLPPNTGIPYDARDIS